MEQFAWIAIHSARLSSFLRSHLSSYSKQAIVNTIRHHRCQVNGSIERFESYKVQPGDHITVSLISEQQELKLLWEDTCSAIYDKPPYVTTEEVATRTGLHIVHRLDRDTSGCLLLGKSHDATTQLMKLFKQRKIHKQYIALVFGHPKKNFGTITTYTAPQYRRCGAVIYGSTLPSQGKITITQWSVLQRHKRYTLLFCHPLTGRTHQIRLQMKLLGHPIVGDIDYGSKQQPPKVFRPLLHAHSLTFTSPFSGKRLKIETSSTEDPRKYAAYLLEN
ncbi:RluA family pseudouridine synthase [Candidatus Chlamydia sanziniae]|uniref:Ribosomal large subunit pseudouridine synthase C n=1 Tax=Candidatus Chlamydia sanziniae TaxID=1806891 RepID=A0A1A9HYX7_9CHLA|nr:RluA family pseudouridine synthase [Candidatus Chlamydia sanziniae]ANH79136.1 Ribosomal large subunit pseudouridine synthase C [Candidatus Chlamydia sanziniae]